MKKESKNQGIRKPCPECKEPVLTSANFLSEGSFHTKCPHCGAFLWVNIVSKIVITVVKVVAVYVILFATILALFGGSAIAHKLNCSVFKNRYDANIYYRSYLDRDRDGVMCEHLKK